ncbi:hypothetical protein MASR1M50_23150 [Burkholderiales bacterium]
MEALHWIAALACGRLAMTGSLVIARPKAVAIQGRRWDVGAAFVMDALPLDCHGACGASQ